VSCPAALESFGKHPLQLPVKGVYQGNARCRGGIVLRVIGLKLKKIEVVPPPLNALRAGQRLVIGGEHGEARRQCKRLLNAEMQQSMPSSSTGIARALMEETVSTIETTSGYFRRTAAISGSGDMTPVEVSL